MFTRRVLSVSILLALALVLVASLAAVSAQAEEETAGGSVTFRDADAMSDSVVIALTGVDVPTAGTRYEGWLIAGDGSKISVGVLTTTPAGTIDHTYVDAGGANLLATYGAFAISVEPSPDPDPATVGLIAYADSVPQGAFTHVGHLVVSWPPNPDSKGITVGLKQQVAVALAYAQLADSSTTLANKQLHLHHVINIIEGSGGANYDASFGDPGDGVGVVNYAADAIAHAQLAMDAATANATVQTHGQGVIDAATLVSADATRARDNSLTALGQSEIDIVVNLSIDNAITNLTKALNGILVSADLDGDGVDEATITEGGANNTYVQAQDIAKFVLIKEGTAQPPQAGDALVGTVATSVLLAGLAFTTMGVLLLRRRRTAAI